MKIEEQIAALLQKKKQTISTAESCTGGLVGATLVNVSGISEHFHEGYITYSNEAKQRLIGVSAQTLEQYGAVSEQTAREMALGCAKAASSDIGIATTGIAGPDGGTKEKPVGLVYIGCSLHGETFVERHIFAGDRQEVRKQSVEQALQLVKRVLTGAE